MQGDGAPCHTTLRGRGRVWDGRLRRMSQPAAGRKGIGGAALRVLSLDCVACGEGWGREGVIWEDTCLEGRGESMLLHVFLVY